MKDIIRFRFVVFAVVLICASAPSFAANASAANPPSVNALWVYSVTSLPNPITDAPTRSTLMQNGSASGVNLLYASVYSSSPDSEGRHLVDEGSIATFIGMAHVQGMQVYAAMGDPDWPSDGCSASKTPYARFSDIAGYNAANPSARFDGVILDVEPGSNPDFTALLGFYQCFQQMVSSAKLGLGAAINAFWTSTVTYNGATKAAYQQIVDLKLSSLVVMGYRNFAGAPDCSTGDGILCLDEPILAYANSVGQGGSIVVGLNTDNPATAGDSAKETFYAMGQAAMNSAAQAVMAQIAAGGQSFGGFSIHNYRDSYLSGQLSGWPATNPSGLLPPAIPTFSAAAVLNSASLTGGRVAPGELLSIFGFNLGPAVPVGPQVAGGKVTTNLAGVQVTFNRVPGPMILAYATQLNVVVPFEVAGSASVTIEVRYNKLMSAPVTVPVVASAAGIYTTNASGAGQAAALNADYTYNNAGHPAAPGSFVTLYLTGAGETSPAGIDGFVAQTTGELSRPVLPVTAEIGGLPAKVLYAGSSEGIVSGVIQVNLLLPSGLSSGPQPVTVTIGSGGPQSGVTLEIQ
jgi:uncharacterized protein (TIGR03437 family)